MADEDKLFSKKHLDRLNAIAPKSVNPERTSPSVASNSVPTGRIRPELGTLDGAYSDGESEVSDSDGAKSPDGDYIVRSIGEPETTTPPAYPSGIEDGETSDQGEDGETSEGDSGAKYEYPEVPGNDHGKVKAKKNAAKDKEDADYESPVNESEDEEEYEDDGLGKDEAFRKRGTRGGLRSQEKK